MEYATIICGRKSKTVEDFIDPVLYRNLLENRKLEVAYTNLGWEVIGVSALLDEYELNTDEAASKIDGALQLFKARTGLDGRIYPCLTTVV